MEWWIGIWDSWIRFVRVNDSAKDIGKRLLPDLSSPDNEDFSREFPFIIIILKRIKVYISWFIEKKTSIYVVTLINRIDLFLDLISRHASHQDFTFRLRFLVY